MIDGAHVLFHVGRFEKPRYGTSTIPHDGAFSFVARCCKWVKFVGSSESIGEAFVITIRTYVLARVIANSKRHIVSFTSASWILESVVRV